MKDPETVTILLVDDDEVDAMAVLRAFKKHGISNPIVVAGDGLEAMEILRGDNGREPLSRPFLILLDLNMPRMDGWEFLDALRRDSALKGSLVYVLTTSDDERDIAAAYDNSVAGYILKTSVGTDFLELVTMVEKVTVVIQFQPSLDSSEGVHRGNEDPAH